MNTHSKIYSHTTEQNETRSNSAPQLSSRFWGKCARMLSVVAISAVATGSAYAGITAAGGDPMPVVYGALSPAASTLQLPLPVGTMAGSSTMYYRVTAANLNTAHGTLTGITSEATPIANAANFTTVGSNTSSIFSYTPTNGYYGPDTFSYTVYEVLDSGPTVTDHFSGVVSLTVRGAPIADASLGTPAGIPVVLPALSGAYPGFFGVIDKATAAANGTLSGTLPVAVQANASAASAARDFIYTPKPGFYGTDTITYNIWNSTHTDTTAPTSTGTMTVNVVPALIEAPATTTTTTIQALTGAGVMLVSGTGATPGIVLLTGNGTDNAGFTGGVAVDGGRLSLGSSFVAPNGLTIAAKHGAKVDSTVSFTLSKVIIG